jgi:hypothetical protein
MWVISEEFEREKKILNFLEPTFKNCSISDSTIKNTLRDSLVRTGDLRAII